MARTSYAAKEIYEDYTLPEQEYMPQEQQREQPQPVLRVIQLRKENNKKKRHIVVFSMVLFCMTMALMVRFASLTQLGYDIGKAEAEYAALTGKIDKMEIALEQSVDLKDIEKIATEKLGMVKPLPYQIVYIKTEVPDHTEYNDIRFTEGAEEVPWYEKILDKIKLFFGFV